jgi:cytochrome b561
MRQFSPSFRVWHWLSAFTMIGIFVTVLLRITVMDKHQIGTIVQTKLSEFGAAISDEQAVLIGKAVRAPTWDIHIYLGIFLSVLLVWRLVLVIKNGFGFDENPSMQKVYVLYRIVYGVLAVMSISGLSLYLKFAGSQKELVETIHQYGGWALFAFVAVHIAGVVLAEKSGQAGLVSQMINGR